MMSVIVTEALVLDEAGRVAEHEEPAGDELLERAVDLLLDASGRLVGDREQRAPDLVDESERREREPALRVLAVVELVAGGRARAVDLVEHNKFKQRFCLELQTRLLALTSTTMCVRVSPRPMSLRSCDRSTRSIPVLDGAACSPKRTSYSCISPFRIATSAIRTTAAPDRRAFAMSALSAAENSSREVPLM